MTQRRRFRKAIHGIDNTDCAVLSYHPAGMSGTASERRQLGRYDLLSKIGSGGMAEVHLARQRGPMGFEKLVVVKLAHRALAKQAAFVEMLHSEARVAALLKHSNVVDVYELGNNDGQYYIAMEYLEGEPLLALLRAGRPSRSSNQVPLQASARSLDMAASTQSSQSSTPARPRPIDVLSMARIIADAAEGLSAVHELKTLTGEKMGLIHHDVSPGNIMVLYSGQVKLLDFGVAKALTNVDHVDPHAARVIAGKLGYLAPEKLQGHAFDHRSDIFSLGVVMWEALTCKRLFKFDNESALRNHMLSNEVPAPSSVSNASNIPAQLDAICLKALKKNPEQRFANASEMASAIESVLHEARYISKNDLIAKYMRETFSDRHAVRLQLIKEASTEAGPSHETAFATLELNQEKQSLDVGDAADAAHLGAQPTHATDVGTLTPTEQVVSGPSAAAPRSKAPTGQPDGQKVASLRRVAGLPAPFVAKSAASNLPGASGHRVAAPALSMPPLAAPIATPIDIPVPNGLPPNQGPASGPSVHQPLATMPATPPIAIPSIAAPPMSPTIATQNHIAATDRTDEVAQRADTFSRWSRSSDEMAALPTHDHGDDDAQLTQAKQRKRVATFVAIGLAGLTMTIILIMTFGGGNKSSETATVAAKAPTSNSKFPVAQPMSPPDAAEPELSLDPADAVEQKVIVDAPTSIDASSTDIETQMQAAIQAAMKTTPGAAITPKSQIAQPTPPKPEVAPTPPKGEPAVPKPAPSIKKTETVPTAIPAPAKVKQSAAEIQSMYQAALQKFMKGDSAGAVTHFQNVVKADRNFAVAWRGLGLSLEKQGRKSEAASALRRYLALSPKASDAAQIKTRLGGL